MSKSPKINFIKTKNMKNVQNKKKTHRSLQKDWILELGAYTGRSIDISYQNFLWAETFWKFWKKSLKKTFFFKRKENYLKKKIIKFLFIGGKNFFSQNKYAPSISYQSGRKRMGGCYKKFYYLIPCVARVRILMLI